jgi:hypothetical protein
VAILQAIFSLIAKSAGKALNAIFGWAVLALFGQTAPREQTLLSALVAAAAVWPILLLGVVLPKVALFVVSFVPLGKSVPSLGLRLVWIALALLVPMVVGIAVAQRAPHQHLPEPGWKKLLRGFPVTAALAAAFLLMLVVAPILKLKQLLTGREVVHLPAMLRNKSMAPEVMGALAGSLAAHGIPLAMGDAPWTMTAPSRILLAIGGQAFSSMAADTIEFCRSDVLEVAVLPNETVLTGRPAEVARARALAEEVFAPRDLSQTFNPIAQLLEKQLKRVWFVLRERGRAHVGARVLASRLDEVAAELADLIVPYDEWQVVYRLALQLDRALHGEPPLLTKHQTVPQEGPMTIEKKQLPGPVPIPNRTIIKPPPTAVGEAVPLSVEAMSNRELVGHVAQNAALLARKEIELARAEIRADLKAELAMAKGLGVAGVCALLTLAMMLVTITLALGHAMPEWLAGIIVTAAVLTVGTVAGLVGWAKRVRNPLEATRRTLKEDAQWAKERLA